LPMIVDLIATGGRCANDLVAVEIMPVSARP
jgi:hypothetical protein